MQSVEESPPADEYVPICGCQYALYYLLLLAVAAVIAAQYSVDPAIGGIAGFISSALRLPSSEPWGLAWTFGCWLTGAILIAMIAKRVLPERKRGALLRYALAAAGSAAAVGSAAWMHAVDRNFFAYVGVSMAPAAGVFVLVNVSIRWQAILMGLAIAGAAIIVTGLLVAPRPSSAWAGTDLSAFIGQERVYAERLASENYDCHDAIRAFAPAKRASDYVSGVIDIDILGPSQYRALLQVSNWIRLPSYRVSLHYAERTRVDVRPDYVSVCLLEPWRSNRARSAPWRWQRSSDGGASWADIPRSPHRQYLGMADYTYRYVPTDADLADAGALLRACVDVRGGGEVCSPGVSPRL